MANQQLQGEREARRLSLTLGSRKNQHGTEESDENCERIGRNLKASVSGRFRLSSITTGRSQSITSLEVQSDEEPPVRLDARADIIPIDGVLGIYTPEQQEIKIFKRGIEDAAKRLSLREQDITLIVRLHEWAHALFHLGLPENERFRVTRDEASWREILVSATANFHSLESGLHERLAQLIVYHAVQSLRSESIIPEAQNALDRIARAFEKLMQHSPSDYRIGKYTSVPRKKVVTSVGLLRAGGLVGLPAWDTVITW